MPSHPPRRALGPRLVLRLLLLLWLSPTARLDTRSQTTSSSSSSSGVPSFLARTHPSSGATTPGAPSMQLLRERARALMRDFPLVDGHSNLRQLRKQLLENRLQDVNLCHFSHSQNSLDSLRDSLMACPQFWSAYTPCQAQQGDTVHGTLEQMDLIRHACTSCSELELVTSVHGLEDTQKAACLISVHGGHSLDSSLAMLRAFYPLGVRALVLTHTCSTPRAESSTKFREHLYTRQSGLTGFGERNLSLQQVLWEMNRLGMMVDLSHAKDALAQQSLRVSEAPVIFSHSAARAVCDSVLNVPDDTLRLPKNQGVIIVMLSMGVLHCNLLANVSTVAAPVDHFDHIRAVIGSEFIGIGGSYDGGDWFPQGLEDVSTYPVLIEELLRRGWSEEELQGVLRGNLLQVFSQVEQRGHPPRRKWSTNQVLQRPIEISPHLVISLVTLATFAALILWYR